MQSLEEEILLEGALAIQASKASTAAARESLVEEPETGGGDEEEPQTDGEDTEGYSDQVLCDVWNLLGQIVGSVCSPSACAKAKEVDSCRHV